MLEFCRKYRSLGIANCIVQLKRIRFMNLQFNIETTFTREDFLEILIGKFHVMPEKVESFLINYAQSILTTTNVGTRAIFLKNFFRVGAMCIAY
jgi:hypothetical protein